jgi:hypothetical protein
MEKIIMTSPTLEGTKLIRFVGRRKLSYTFEYGRIISTLALTLNTNNYADIIVIMSEWVRKCSASLMPRRVIIPHVNLFELAGSPSSGRFFYGPAEDWLKWSIILKRCILISQFPQSPTLSLNGSIIFSKSTSRWSLSCRPCIESFTGPVQL